MDILFSRGKLCPYTYSSCAWAQLQPAQLKDIWFFFFFSLSLQSEILYLWRKFSLSSKLLQMQWSPPKWHHLTGHFKGLYRFSGQDILKPLKTTTCKIRLEVSPELSSKFSPVITYLEDHAGSVVFSLIYTHVVSDMNKYVTNHLKAPEAYFTVNELSAFNGGRSLYVWRHIWVSEGSFWAKILTPKTKGKKIVNNEVVMCLCRIRFLSVYVKKYSTTPFLLP